MAYWRQRLIDYRKQHPKVEGDPKSDKAMIVKPRTMTGEELASLRKRLGLYQREMVFKIGISSRQLRNLESGKCLISKRISEKAGSIQAEGDTSEYQIHLNFLSKPA